jgi:CheY-like chemotaxis protein
LGHAKAVILCVDDEENSLILRKLVLQKSGYDVVIANSGKEALELLRRCDVDLVLSDQLMPGTTGTQLARQVKALYPSLPVVIVSGVNEVPSDANHADLFLSKLEGPVVLSQRISEVLIRFQNSE